VPPALQLFNGDFVDRGSFSVEVITTMMTFKVLYPNHYHITRGNHETNDMNKIYGFEGEVKHKYVLRGPCVRRPTLSVLTRRRTLQQAYGRGRVGGIAQVQRYHVQTL